MLGENDSPTPFNDIKIIVDHQRPTKVSFYSSGQIYLSFFFRNGQVGLFLILLSPLTGPWYRI